MLNWIIWNRTVFTFNRVNKKKCTYAKLNCLKWNCFWHLNCVLALNWIVGNRIVYIKKYNQLNNQYWLICHKTKLNQNQSKKGKAGDRSRGYPEGSLFNSYYTEVLGRALLLSLDCSTWPLIRTLYCKEVSSTILKVFGMTRLGIEPWSTGLLA